MVSFMTWQSAAVYTIGTSGTCKKELTSGILRPKRGFQYRQRGCRYFAWLGEGEPCRILRQFLPE